MEGEGGLTYNPRSRSLIVRCWRSDSVSSPHTVHCVAISASATILPETREFPSFAHSEC